MRFKSGVARPCARGSQRLSVGPAPATASFTIRSSIRTLPTCSAFATADFSTFCTMRAPYLGVNSSVLWACSTVRPRISSSTWPHLRGVMRTNLWIARASISGRLSGRGRRRSARSRGLLRHVLAVPAEHAGRHELAQLVADHVLGHVNRQELVPVVDRKRVPHEVGQDRAAPRPGLEHALLAAAVQVLDLLHQGLDHVRSLLDGTCHAPLLLLPPAQDERVAQLALAGLESLRDLPPGRAR